MSSGTEKQISNASVANGSNVIKTPNSRKEGITRDFEEISKEKIRTPSGQVLKPIGDIRNFFSTIAESEKSVVQQNSLKKRVRKHSHRNKREDWTVVKRKSTMRDVSQNDPNIINDNEENGSKQSESKRECNVVQRPLCEDTNPSQNIQHSVEQQMVIQSVKKTTGMSSLLEREQQVLQHLHDNTSKVANGEEANHTIKSGQLAEKNANDSSMAIPIDQNTKDSTQQKEVEQQEQRPDNVRGEEKEQNNNPNPEVVGLSTVLEMFKELKKDIAEMKSTDCKTQFTT